MELNTEIRDLDLLSLQLRIPKSNRFQPLRMSLPDGDLAVLDDLFSFREYNNFLTSFAAAGAIANPQAGVIQYFTGTQLWRGYDGGAFKTLMNELKDDLTPQYGGDVDLNGFNIDFPTTPNISDCLDENNMVSNSPTKLCTQRSIKTYIDNQVLGSQGFREGFVTAFNPSWFEDDENGTPHAVLPNNAADLNTLFNPFGHYVCDGSLLNDPASTIFDGAGRRLPNLTGDRFLMGAAGAGLIGGSSTMPHGHADNFSTVNESTHTHDEGNLVAINHVHPINIPNTDTGVPSATESTEAGTGDTMPTSNHQHPISYGEFNSEQANADVEGDTGTGTAHAHAMAGAVGVADNTENRPKYFKVWFLIYVKA